MRASSLEIRGIKYTFQAPGFKQVDRGGEYPALYWQAADDAIEAGYPTKSVPLPIASEDFNDPHAAIEKIVRLCNEQQTQMLDWLDGNRNDRTRLEPKFDGTVESLIDCYESDEDSAYAEVSDETADGYRPWFKMIRQTVGKRLIAKIVAKEFRRWYRNWKKMASKRGYDGTRTAYGCIQALRILLNYGIESGITRCRILRADMDKMRFARNSPREETLSYEQVKAVVLEALRIGWKNLALAAALQFECVLRQKDVIGSWTKVSADYVAQPGEIVMRGKVWRGLTMDMIALSADLRIRTHKTGAPVIHKLSACELVVLALNAFTPDEWNGPVARRPNGTPWPDRQSYARDWRAIADTVGISRETKNMDSRAGGISEAAEAGVSDEDIQRQTGHAGKAIIAKTYKRLGTRTSERSHKARQTLRLQERDGGMAHEIRQSATDERN